jgi:hypothetical protein
MYLSDCKTGRTESGSIVEGAIGLWLIVVMLVMGVLLLVNCGMAAYYKGKLGYVAQECARYAAGLPDDKDPTPKTERFADDLMRHLGLPVTSASVKVEKAVLGDLPAMRVTVGNSKLALFGNGSILPTVISMSDTAEAARDPYRPTGLLYLYCRGQNVDRGDGRPNTTMCIPTYGRRVKPYSDTLLSPTAERPAGTAVFYRPHSERYWMSFPSGGFNESIPSKGLEYYYYDYGGDSGFRTNVPADGYFH